MSEPPRPHWVAVLGPRPTRRLSLAHALDDVGDAMVTVSMAGSLFFSVSFDASRERILLYLVLTALPLALVAPVVGPVLDRTRVGQRTLLTGSQLARLGLALALAGSLGTVRFYPLIFGVLLARKAYSLARTAVVARLAADEQELVRASGHLARVGTVAGGAGMALAGLLLAAVGVEVLPIVGACWYLAAAVVSAGIRMSGPHDGSLEALDGDASHHTPHSVLTAARAVAALRAATGALTFLIALAIKRGGSDTWVFVAALAAAGVGSFAGTLLAPRIHRRLGTERMVAASLLLPGVVALAGVLSVGQLGIAVLALGIGLGNSVATRSMDVLYGRAPTSSRARVISSSEVWFQVANVVGAALAVTVAPGPRSGFGAVAVLLVFASLWYAQSERFSLRREAGHLLIGRRTGAMASEVSLRQALHDEARFAVRRSDGRMALLLLLVAEHARHSGDLAAMVARVDSLSADDALDQAVRRLTDLE